jgi:hypothetical protein
MKRRNKRKPVRPKTKLGLPDFHPSTRRDGACWGPRGTSQGGGDREFAFARFSARISPCH